MPELRLSPLRKIQLNSSEIELILLILRRRLLRLIPLRTFLRITLNGRSSLRELPRKSELETE